MKNNKVPTRRPKFTALPLGDIKAKGWMLDQLRIQSKGIPGRADEFFFRNEWWLGGDGPDDPSRKPTDTGARHLVLGWLSTMQTMAIMLDDKDMLGKVKKYAEYMLSTQKEDGSFGPEPPKDCMFPDAMNDLAFFEPARVSAANFLLNYYDYSKDERALKLVKKFVLKYYGEKVIQSDGWTWCNNVFQKGIMGVATQLYNITGDNSYIDAVEEFISHVTPENDMKTSFKEHDPKFTHGGVYGTFSSLAHDYLCGDDECKEIIYDGVSWIDETQGQAPGHHTAHEFIAKEDGTNPTMGSECCLISGDYSSMRTFFETFGDNVFADRAEELVFNAVPAYTTADTWARQYDQQVNQVLCNVAKRRFDNRDDANTFGIDPHYPCCTASIGRPLVDFINHQWYATQDGGLAAFSYCSCTVETEVADGQKVVLDVESEYPFRGSNIKFTVHTKSPVEFPIYLRSPKYIGDYNERTFIKYDGRINKVEPGDTHIIRRTWKDGDVFYMNIPMFTKFIERSPHACAVKRGPLYYALRIDEAYKQMVHNYLGSADWEIYPTTSWNIALYTSYRAAYASITEEHNEISEIPWAHNGAVLYNEDKDRFYTWRGKEPVILRARGRVLKNWQMDPIYAQSGDIPDCSDRTYGPEVEVELIPYGCTNLRIAEFPSIL